MNQLQQPKQFNPMAVPIEYTFDIGVVNLILKGWDKLPREETKGLYEQVQSAALKKLQEAESAFHAKPDEETTLDSAA